MSCSDEDDFKSCHTQDRGYWAAHGNTDLQQLPSSHSALESETHAQVAEMLGYDGNCIRWNMEEFQCKLDQLMWYWAISVRQVKPQNMKFTLLSFGTLYLLPYHGCVFNASWKTWEPSLLTTCVNVVVSAEEACHPSCQNWENSFPSMVSKAMLLNWSMVVEFHYLGMKITTAYCHSTWINWFFHTAHMSFHKIFVTCGQFFYTLYGSPFGLGAEADLAFLRTNLISHSLGGEVSKGVLGGSGCGT